MGEEGTSPTGARTYHGDVRVGPVRRSTGFGSLRGATVLLTGAGGALGDALADALAAEGANLVLSDLDASDLEQRASRLRRGGVRVSVHAANLLRDDGIDGLMDAVGGELGPIDVLVSNAGIETNSRFDRLAGEDIDAQLGIHLRGPMMLTRALLPGMLDRGRGHVVIVSSLNGKLPFPRKAAYSAAKAGSIAFVHSLRRDLRDEPVGVSVVCPALVRGGGQAERAIEESGAKPPARAGSCTPRDCGAAVVKAITTGRPEIAVSSRPTSALAALQWSFPRVADHALELTGMPGFWRRIAAREESTS
jgi:short-subunit dehydrogenase